MQNTLISIPNLYIRIAAVGHRTEDTLMKSKNLHLLYIFIFQKLINMFDPLFHYPIHL